MKEIKITIVCPRCSSTNIVKNGKKSYKNKQNYLCKDCSRQFISDYCLDYKGCHSSINQRIKNMFVRGLGVRDIAFLEEISFRKILSVLVNCSTILSCKQAYYDCLEIDEFWTFVGKKSNKVWLIYAYHRETGEIVAWVFGKRNAKTARKLYKIMKQKGIKWSNLAYDNWRSFKKVFQNEPSLIGKEYTQGIEGNNCRLRHRIRRAFRKTCNFSKKEENHIKHFELIFHYINLGFV
jgi:IS1 family transposase/transposase-like protein